MGKKKKDDPFGFERTRKAITFNVNKMRGKDAETVFKIEQGLRGHDVKRTPKGRDFEVQEKDFWGRKKGKPYSVEVKTGDAKLSKLQKKRKKKEGKRYKVIRY